MKLSGVVLSLRLPLWRSSREYLQRSALFAGTALHMLYAASRNRHSCRIPGRVEICGSPNFSEVLSEPLLKRNAYPLLSRCQQHHLEQYMGQNMLYHRSCRIRNRQKQVFQYLSTTYIMNSLETFYSHCSCLAHFWKSFSEGSPEMKGTAGCSF